MGAKLELEVIVANNGQAALEKCQTEQPGYALLDVSMPEMNGIDCCKAIKQASPLTKVMLISTVHSLSLQDAARDAQVDLFIVDTVASVKVPELIEATLAKKDLPPEAAEDIEREVLSKRGAQRFPFEGEVQYKITDDWQSGVLVNVSQDGLLFQTAIAVPLGTNITMSWMDQGLKHIEITAIVVRQFSSPHPQYPYLIGVQFLKSSPILDEKIAALSEDTDFFSEGSEIELDMDLIEQMLANRGTYFRDLFQGGKAPLFVEFSIADIVEHERASFQNKDEYSLCLQEIVTSKIICQLIENAANQIGAMKAPVKGYPTRLLTLLSELLEKIEYVEDDSDALVKKSIQDGKVNERRQLNESNSRLYNAKAAVLETFSKKIKRQDIIESHVGGYDEIIKQNKQITSYQEHLDEIAKQEQIERKKMAAERITKPVERPVIKAPPPPQIINPDYKPPQRFSNIQIAAAIILFLALIPRIEELRQSVFVKDDMTLVAKPQSIDRKSDGSIVIQLTKAAWDELGERGQELIMDQIEVYLTKKELHQCKIMDGDQTIAAVYSSIADEYPGFLHRSFLNVAEQQPVAQPTSRQSEPVVEEPEEKADEAVQAPVPMKKHAPAVKKAAPKKKPAAKKKKK